MNKLNWGIVTTGVMAAKFVDGLRGVLGSTAYAVYGRNVEKAEAFRLQFEMEKAYSDLDEMLADPVIDIIYIASPHTMHAEHALMALSAGKHVLVEKPFGINALEARQIADKAREMRLFAMEAMWTRFLPIIKQVKRWLTTERLGKIYRISADFGFKTEYDPMHRLFNMDLAGGSLLDVGVYPISLASFLLGRQPDQINATASNCPSGVDGQTSMMFAYQGGTTANLTSAIVAQTGQTAVISGEKGTIRIPSFWCATTATLTFSGGKTAYSNMPFPKPGNGYTFEAREVEKCIRKGLLECPELTLNESIAIMETMDAIRKQIGLVYPQDQK